MEKINSFESKEDLNQVPDLLMYLLIESSNSILLNSLLKCHRPTQHSIIPRVFTICSTNYHIYSAINYHIITYIQIIDKFIDFKIFSYIFFVGNQKTNYVTFTRLNKSASMAICLLHVNLKEDYKRTINHL